MPLFQHAHTHTLHTTHTHTHSHYTFHSSNRACCDRAREQSARLSAASDSLLCVKCASCCFHSKSKRPSNSNTPTHTETPPSTVTRQMPAPVDYVLLAVRTTCKRVTPALWIHRNQPQHVCPAGRVTKCDLIPHKWVQ